MVAPEPIFEPRGTPLSVLGRLKALSDMGYAVDLLTYPMGETVAFPGLRIDRIPKVPGIRTVKIGPSMQKIPLDILLFLKTVRRLAQSRYGLLHTHEEAGFWGILLSRCFRVPHLYDMHSSLPQQLENFRFTKSRLLIRLFQHLEKTVLRTAQGVIVICPELKAHADAVVSHPNLMLIENVVDYGMVFGETTPSPDIRKTLGLHGKRVVVYSGTFEPYQGLDLLIQSAAAVVRAVPSVRFLMVGGHPNQVEACRRRVSEKKLESYFHFTGQVLPSSANGYIRCADVLVSPRTAGNNTPLKVYAYLRSGVPIVATRLITHTQVLDDRVAILAEPDPASFAHGIVSALTDARRAWTVSRNARILAETHYGYGSYRSRLRRVVRAARAGRGC